MAMAKNSIRTKTYYCGTKRPEYIEIDLFPCLEQERRYGRKGKEKLTAPKQRNLNAKRAKRYFCLLLKTNFTEGDIHVTLTYNAKFLPETIEQALEPGYKPPYYRNVFLCNAMVNLYMIDTNSMGIPMVYQIQRDKCFPLPTYDLNTINRVRVIVYGKILDKNYTQLLHSNGELDIQTVFLLDKVQKGQTISKESFKRLKRQGLVEGRYPNLFVSFKVADSVGQKADYIRNKGLEDDICKQLIVKALEAMGEAGKQELVELLEKALPDVLSEEQKSKKVSNLLQAMKKEGTISVRGTNRYAKWYINY